MSRLLLVDGDDLIWRVATTAASPAAIPEQFRRRIGDMAEKLKGDRLLFALSDQGNWRKALWPDYKAHRAARPRPPLLAPCREALEAGWETRSAPGLEADDVLGLAATDPDYLQAGAPAAPDDNEEPAIVRALRLERAKQPAASAIGDERVIVSRDKDLLTVPGLHGAVSGALIRVSQSEADLEHLVLALAGDASDGYKGCPGIGPKRARRLLSSAPPCAASRWRAVVSAYVCAGRSEEEALLQARLARVLRAGEVDGDGRPILWRPEGGSERLGRAGLFARPTAPR